MADDQNEPNNRVRVVHRSPAYPAIGLEDAIAKARLIWDKERANDVALDVLAGHLGYKTAVGPGGVTISALIKFGLIADEGSGAKRRARLTERGRRIVLGSEDRVSLLKEAALLPAIHKELWDKYGVELPSRESMRRYLVVERNFNERVVDDFVEEYIGTLNYANLRGAIRNGGDEEPPADQDEASPRQENGPPFVNGPKGRIGMTVLSFQISDRLVEVAVAGGPLTKSEIKTLKAYLAIQETIAPDHADALPVAPNELDGA